MNRPWCLSTFCCSGKTLLTDINASGLNFETIVTDWSELGRRKCSHVFLDSVDTKDIETYCSVQSRVCVFLGNDKLIQEMNSIGYRLIYRINTIMVFETKSDLISLPKLTQLSDNVYTRKAPSHHMKPWYPTDDIEYMRLATYFLSSPSLYVAIHKDMTSNLDLCELEQKSFSSFIKFLPGKEVNGLLYEFNINEKVAENKIYFLRIFVLKKSGNIPTHSSVIPIHVTKNVPELLGSFTNKEHDKILHYQHLEMVKKLHKTRPFHGGGWEVSQLPSESSFPKTQKILEDLSPKDRYRTLIVSAGILEILGTTVAADSDLIVWNEENSPSLNALTSNGLDALVWNGKKYLDDRDFWEQWLNKDFPKLYGADSMEETVFDPRFHFYWKGLKFISLDASIAKLVRRARPSAYTDLLILDKIGVPIKFPIPVPKKTITDAHVYDFTTKSGQNQLLGTIQFYMKTWHNLNISTQELRKKLRF